MEGSDINPAEGSVGKAPGRPRRTVSRRRFLKIVGGAALTGMGLSALDALAIEPDWLQVNRPVIRIPRLPAAWEGVSVAHITDVHLDSRFGPRLLRKVVDVINSAAPDIVVMTGDYGIRSRLLARGKLKSLSQIRAPQSKFAVLGNHDYETDPAAVCALLRAAGFEVLMNSHRMLLRGESRLCVAGVPDPWEDKPSVADALAGAAEEPPRILLCHNPDYAEEMPRSPRVDLMLSGHTHGGQVNLPFFGPPFLPIRHRKYASGLVQGPCCPVYASRGLGTVGPPVRFNCRPELPLLTLRNA
jgi:predicted MPP superfamily phosphohydrolase